MKKKNLIYILIPIMLLCFQRVSLLANEKNDFNVKGFHLDLRAEVMTMPALKKFAEELSDIGVNTLIMEWEATFPYTKHATLSNKYAYSRKEIQDFIKHCSNLGIDVIPLQNCFGHVEFILRHDRYTSVKEDWKDISQVCPLKIDENKEIFKELFTEMAELHPSEFIHIGCDETRLLGSCGNCQAFVKEHGKSKLFVNYVKEMCDIVISLGKQPVIWGDILLKHPEAADELPKSIKVIDWNYGWDVNYFGNVDDLIEKGFKFWGAPSIRCHPDNLYLTQWNIHFKNIQEFIPHIRKKGYEGVVMTSWSTSGLYGFLHDLHWEVQEMYPIRYVYPLSGFNILLSAYDEALKTPNPIDIDSFVVNYAETRFGFKREDATSFLSAIMTPQSQITNFKSRERQAITAVANDFATANNIISKLKPLKNLTEYEHLKLIFELRSQYLAFKKIESIYQSESFERTQADSMLNELLVLSKSSKKVDKKFLKLNKGFLLKDELLQMNMVRNKKMNNLIENLKKMTKL